jgi:hypothetical protein
MLLAGVCRQSRLAGLELCERLRHLQQIHWALFCSSVLQMWSRSATRMERPHSRSPRLIDETAMANAASFSARCQREA